MGAQDGPNGDLKDFSRLRASAELLKQRLAKSQSTSDSMVSILSSFDERLSTLEAAMRPTQVRTHAYRKAHENIEGTLKQAEEVLAQFDVSRQVEPRIKEGPKKDLDAYLKAVDRLHDTVTFFNKNRQFKSSEAAMQHAKDLLREALVRLEEDFRKLLGANSKSVDPEKISEYLPDTVMVKSSEGEEGKERGKAEGGARVISLPELLPPLVVQRLHAIAERMVSGGAGPQCTSVYRDLRDKTLEQSLRRLGVEKLKADDIYRMQWEELEGRISGWVKHLRIAILVLFAAERKLCEQIFKGLDPIRERTFADAAENGSSMLLSFGEAIARSKRSPEKLFVLLDMYETLQDLMPHIDAVFSGGPCAQIREAAHALLKRLAQTSKETFVEFEEAVEKDNSKAPVADGAVHPLTSYVINYVKFLFEYHATLQQLYSDSSGGTGPAAPGVPEEKAGNGKARLADKTARIVSVLQANLENKSKLYRDPALTQLFLMNNVHYMVRNFKTAEAKDMLGDDWVQRHRRVVQQHATSYQRAAWNKVLQTLSAQGLGTDTAVNRTAVKERFKSFNSLFEEVHQRQCLWIIPDPELRSAVQLQVAEVLLPAYRSFLNRYSAILEHGGTAFGKGGSNAVQKYIKYRPEDIDALLGELFEGKASPGQPAAAAVR
eukprot:TRINITY_DN13727_c0_g1_i1.p1 TRINITY_DN13727_c0_g1~~TRINITY_DN13727_c0_g1_i1.p1  ORF type:complete len:660 (-),score=163.46 TRINITY_DN13727_c0_g1_i1:943-2922(-)